MRAIVIQNKIGEEIERIKLSNNGFNDVMKYAREKRNQEREGDSEEISAYTDDYR